MPTPLNVLIVGTSQADAELLAQELRRAGFEPDWIRVDTWDGYRASLEDPPDLIISDYTVPPFGGLRAMDLLQKLGLDIPFILISGMAGEEKAAEAMKHGVTDFLLKGQIGRLGSAAERALGQKRLRDDRERMLQQLAVQTAALQASEQRFALALQGANDGLWDWNLETDEVYYSPRWKSMLGYSDEELENRLATWKRLVHPEDRATTLALVSDLVEGRTEKFEVEFRMRHKTGYDVHILSRAFFYDTGGKTRRLVGTHVDISERKRAKVELEQMHNRMLAVSRQAGRAEFATGVLHNVGNVLNSVSIASTCMSDSLKRSKSTSLAKVVTLIRQHEADLGAFFTHDPKGKKVPAYLAQLADQLAGEQATALKELGELQKNIEHIKGIITVQQDSAKMSRTPEALKLTYLVEQALKLTANDLQRCGIRVIKEFEEVPPIIAEEHTVLQILVNLVRNAVQACEGSSSQDKRLTLRVSQHARRIRVAVADNGSGILPEHLARIFAHGFTTKQDGHGFGLHSAALSARAMNGSLSVQSGGPGQGATFTLELPLHPQEKTSARGENTKIEAGPRLQAPGMKRKSPG
jgi:PAS domain S-box-containing protein